MDYHKHYDSLVTKAKLRVLSGYVEVHHIVPRCMGGNDDPTNLVQLTPEEHFVAHQLLCKMFPQERGLAFAAQAMTADTHGHRSNNKLFGWLRRRYALAQKGRVKSEQERKNIAASRRTAKRRVFSEEARKNMAEARRKTWEERRKNGTDKLIAEKVVATRRANGSYEFSEEWKRNIGKSGIGRKPWHAGKTGVYSEETLQKMRDAKIKHSTSPRTSSGGGLEEHTTRMSPA